MHLFIISSKILKNILDIIILDNISIDNIVFHIVYLDNTHELRFQGNYNNDVYISYTINFQYLIDIQEFESIALNYEQCKTLQRLTYMYDSNIGIIDSDGLYDIFVSHTNIKLVLYIDDMLDQEYIYPPSLSSIEYIDINIDSLYNGIKLVANNEYLTPFRIDSKKSRLIFGDVIQSIVQLKKMSNNIYDSDIDINPDHIIKFLEYLIQMGKETIKIKINKKIAFMIYFSTDIGEVYYYNGHNISIPKIVNM